MTREELLAALVKLACALPVLRWPLAGALVAIAADAADVVIMNYVDLGGGGIRDYHVFDKLTDVPALLTFFVAALGFGGRDRAIAVTLFCARLTGIALYELAGLRWALVAFPNLFESWFLYVLLRDRIWGAEPGPASGRTRIAFLSVLVAGKLAQEYILHQAQWFDRIALSDVVNQLRTWVGGGGR